MLQGSLGASNSAAIKPATISSIIDDFGHEIESAHVLLERIRCVADRLQGGKPRDAGQKTAQPEPNAHLTRLQERREGISMVLSEIAMEIGRIENVVL